MPQNKLVSGILLLFCAAIIGVIYLNREWQTFQHLRARTARLEGVLQELDDLGSKRDTLQEKISSIPADELTRISQILPRGPGIQDLLSSLERLSAKNRVIPHSIVTSVVRTSLTPLSLPQPEAYTAGNLRELPLILGITGSYQDFKNFLKDLEKFVRLTDISSISFGSLVVPDGRGSFNIQGKVYYQ